MDILLERHPSGDSGVAWDSALYNQTNQDTKEVDRLGQS